jgi:hypothetical protein
MIVGMLLDYHVGLHTHGHVSWLGLYSTDKLSYRGNISCLGLCLSNAEVSKSRVFTNTVKFQIYY